MGTDQNEERRRALRFLLDLPVEVKVPSREGPQVTSTRTRDVSSRGLYFALTGAVEIGSPIEFTFILPEELTSTREVRVRCVGRVVRVDPPQPNSRGEGESTGIATVIEEYSVLAPEQGKPTN